MNLRLAFYSAFDVAGVLIAKDISIVFFRHECIFRINETFIEEA